MPARFGQLDLVLVRENTEDLYSGLEHEVVPGVMVSLKVITAAASTRIARFAFEYARRHGRQRVTAVHKANIMKMGDGLFLACAREVAAEYPEISYDERIVDAACMHLVLRPETFDVLRDAEPVRRHRLGPVRRAGRRPRRGRAARTSGTDVAVFEAVHGTAPDIAGQDVANPTALLLSALMMLHHIGEGTAADRIRAALERVLEAGQVRTRDLGRRGHDDRVRRRDLRGAADPAPALGGPQARGSHALDPRPEPSGAIVRAMGDDISQAVLAREEVVRYLRGGHGEDPETARARVYAYLDELRTTQRYSLYRALKHPVYPILRKIERHVEHVERAVEAATRAAA